MDLNILLIIASLIGAFVNGRSLKDELKSLPKLNSVESVINDITESKPSFNVKIGSLLNKMTSTNEESFKVFFESMLNTEFKRLDDAIDEASNLATKIQSQKQMSIQFEKSEPKSLLANTTKEADKLIKAVNPVAKELNDLLSAIFAAVFAEKLEGSKKTEILVPNKIIKAIGSAAGRIVALNKNAVERIKKLNIDLKQIEQDVPYRQLSSFGLSPRSKFASAENHLEGIVNDFEKIEKHLSSIDSSYRKINLKKIAGKPASLKQVGEKLYKPMIKTLEGYEKIGVSASKVDSNLRSVAADLSFAEN